MEKRSNIIPGEEKGDKGTPRHALRGHFLSQMCLNRGKIQKNHRILNLETEICLGQNHNLEQEETPGETELPLPFLSSWDPHLQDYSPQIKDFKAVSLPSLPTAWPHLQLCKTSWKIHIGKKKKKIQFGTRFLF